MLTQNRASANAKWNIIFGFSYSKNMANFESETIYSSIILIFLKSGKLRKLIHSSTWKFKHNRKNLQTNFYLKNRKSFRFNPVRKIDLGWLDLLHIFCLENITKVTCLLSNLMLSAHKNPQNKRFMLDKIIYLSMLLDKSST